MDSPPPPSTQQTHRRFLDVQLNAAILDFAPKYMKSQLEQLAHECDQRLERQLLPRLHAVLREIDQERDAFEEQKRDATRLLRERLSQLPLDDAAVDHAVGQLRAVAPRYLALLPTASSLALPPFDSTSVSAPSTSTSLDGALSAPDQDTSSQDPASPRSTPETLTHAAQGSATPIEPRTPPTKLLTLENEVQAQVLAESSTIPCSSKRPNDDHQDENEVSPKRQRTTNEKTPGVVRPQIERRVAFPNLMTGECIFRHAERRGFFVVRCKYCESGFFTEPPLRYNRALKHFQKHGEDVFGKEDLTNEYIFENFAFQVDGDEMASKYWIREHLGEMPHTFIPVGTSESTSQADNTEDMVHRHQEIEDAFSPPFSKLRESPRNRQSGIEVEHEKPRRARRNIPRLDYADMVAYKDPWNTSDTEIEKTVEKVNTTRSTASKKRRLTKPGFSSASKTADTKKPFGYLSEPWPRRSAPR